MKPSDLIAPAHSPSLLGAVIESAPTALVMTDAHGCIVLVNAETEHLFGFPRAELLGQPVEMLVPQRFRGLHPAYRTAFFADPHRRRMGAGRDLFGLRKDGSEVSIEIGLNPIKSDDGVFVLSAIVDISERKRLEARFRATIESAPTAMVMIDPNGCIALVNLETEKLFGYPRTELMGQAIEFLVPERLRSRHPQMRENFFATSEARRMGERRDLYGLRKNGSEFPVEIGLSPVEMDDGTYVLSAIVDISERKRLEAAQQQLNDELDRRVKERTAELARSNDALVMSNVELQQFAYIASHDLQAPLRGIIGFSQILRKRYQNQLDAEADALFTRIADGVTRMQTLINDLLSYARVESRSRPFQNCKLNEIFDDVVNLLASSIRDSEAQVTRGELPVVSGDRSQLVQLLQNLIGNAIKYHGPQPPRVHVSAACTHDEWVISVRDNGIGIDPKHHERIFEIFRRLHSTQAYPGTGIGLAVCRRIVLRHDGKLWVESAVGQGSTFHFTLKASTTEAA